MATKGKKGRPIKAVAEVDVASVEHLSTITGKVAKLLADVPQQRGEDGSIWVDVTDVLLIVNAVHRHMHPDQYPIFPKVDQ